MNDKKLYSNNRTVTLEKTRVFEALLQAGHEGARLSELSSALNVPSPLARINELKAEFGFPIEKLTTDIYAIFDKRGSLDIKRTLRERANAQQ